MAGPAALERAWNAAKPRLAAIQSSLSTAQQPELRAVRVGQLDAELLDQELVQVLQEPITRALSLINNNLRAHIEPELSLLIQLVLYKLSVWDNGGSYGAKLQDLRYVVPPSSNSPLTSSGLPRRTLLLHGSLTVLLPYLRSRLRILALSRAWPDAPSSDRRRKAWDVLVSTESLHTLLGLVNFVAFLWSGRYRTLADRLLSMQLVPSQGQVKRDVSYEFMNRQMVWHAFTEFLLFLLPLLHARSVRRRVYRLLSYLNPAMLLSLIPPRVANRLGFTGEKGASGSSLKRHSKFWALPASQCAICAENASFNLNISEPANMFSALIPQAETNAEGSEDEPSPYPINLPYVASCGDIYCYSCIVERLMRAADELDNDRGWECLRCGEKITSADRYEVEITGIESGSDYEFSSDIDFDAADVSGSIGSYSGSGLSDN